MARCRVSGRQLTFLGLFTVLVCTAVNQTHLLSAAAGNTSSSSSQISVSHPVRGRTATEEYNEYTSGQNKVGHSTEYKSLEQPPVEEYPSLGQYPEFDSKDFQNQSPGDGSLEEWRKQPSTSVNHEEPIPPVQLLLQEYPADKPLPQLLTGDSLPSGLSSSGPAPQENVYQEDLHDEVSPEKLQQGNLEDLQKQSIILESVQPEYRGIKQDTPMGMDSFQESEVSKDDLPDANQMSLGPLQDNQVGKDHSEDNRVSMEPVNEGHISMEPRNEGHVSMDVVDERHVSIEPERENQESMVPVQRNNEGLVPRRKKVVVAKKRLQKTHSDIEEGKDSSTAKHESAKHVDAKGKSKPPVAKSTHAEVSEVTTDGTVSSSTGASPYSVPFVFSPPCYLCRTEICPNNGTSLKVIILVTSAPSHFEQRMTVRRTWGSFSQRKDVKVAFVLGKTDNETLIYKVLHETEVYGDVVIGDFTDAYQNLTLKTMFLLQYASQYCADAKFVLKTDDDVFIHVENLLKLLSKNTEKKYGIWGVSHNKLTPHRNKKDKYFVPKTVYSKDKYPLFFAGPAYVMTKDTAVELRKNAEGCEFFPLEDVFFTGIVAERIKIPKYRTKAMKVSKKKIKYNMKEVISIHGQDRKQMFKTWNSIVSEVGNK